MSTPAFTESPQTRSASRAREDARLISDYRATGNPRVRDRLVFTYAPLVKYLVGKKLRSLPGDVDADDLTSSGLEALIRCVDRFDPEAGATFEAFVWTRVQGAILDELRRGDWAPRTVRRHEREAAVASARFRIEHGRDPEPAELAEVLGVTVERLRERDHDVATATLSSLNATMTTTEDADIERIETLAADDPDLDPEHVAAREAARRRLADAIAGLSARDREVMVMLHTHHMTLVEVGAVLGVTESRVSQIHTAIRRKLAAELADDRVLFELA